jgi:putative ATP-dependent endonuclease of the OLD family
MNVIKKVYIKNFKTIREIDLVVDREMNIIVGNNEVGKSTLLEAIDLALTCQLNNRNIINELSPYLFNKDTVNDYIQSLNDETPIQPPCILIEIYLNDNDKFTVLKGTNNSKHENSCGVFLHIHFDEEFSEEYELYIENPDIVRTIPIEYYKVDWFSFAHNGITKRSLPVNCTFIDATNIKLLYGNDFYIKKMALQDSL